MKNIINTNVNEKPYDLSKSSKIREDNQKTSTNSVVNSPYDLSRAGFKGFK